ncbi:MAG TPA: MmgE/PrpD family protein [Candidatus Binatia bacterium]|nr:MmgE/PrpD family protein [Candidatus Binatia bacterium]HEX5022673.1 MmgE/PrpD family protein [Candidatus Binatia bacterium]
MNETSDLAKWMVELKWVDIPREVIDYSKILVLDTLGCMLGGSIQDSNKAALRYTRAMGGSPDSTVVNYGDRTNPFNAAFINASFGHGWDFDDMINAGAGHAVSACTAATMALAEKEIISGREFLEAWITGYEVSNRVGAATKPGHLKRGFHEVGTIGPFAGSAAASKILRLNEWQSENAIGITVSQAAGTFQHSQTTGGAIKRCHAGFAAASGVRSALLAKEGMTAAREALEGKKGFVLCHSGDENDMHAITRDLGKDWYTTKAAMKPYSCCAGQYGMLDIIYKMKGKYDLKPENIERIKLWGSIRNLWMVGTIKGEEVKDIFGAQFSARFGVGLALVVGENRIKAYHQNIPPFGKWAEVVELAKKVDVYSDDEIPERGPIFGYAKCEIQLKDGRTLKGESGSPMGFPGNPMQREERLEKFYGQALLVQTKEKADRIVELVENLENLEDIRPIVRNMIC